ncbi:hypothetical protein [Thermococcus sp.]|uniref:hypothetical protein n=1 Tax=Thermococcus sp. TaxID=35749 RepID=UPI0026084C2E|nr:hypothetical protein [Thermococcus sp.]
MTPYPELVNATLSICMGYTHTWSWVAFTSVLLGTVITAPFYFVPEGGSFLGYLITNAVVSFTAYEIQGRLPDKDSWTISKMFKVKLDYSEYPLRGAPSTPPAFGGRYALVSVENGMS